MFIKYKFRCNVCLLSHVKKTKSLSVFALCEKHAHGADDVLRNGARQQGFSSCFCHGCECPRGLIRSHRAPNVQLLIQPES